MSFERNSYRSVGPNAHILGTVLEYDSNRPDDSSDGWKWAVGLVLVVAEDPYISEMVSMEPGPRNISSSSMSAGATRMPSAAKRARGPSSGLLVMG